MSNRSAKLINEKSSRTAHSEIGFEPITSSVTDVASVEEREQILQK